MMCFKLLSLLLPGILLTAELGCAQSNQAIPATPPLHFTEKKIASENFESVGVFDVNDDGKLDIVSGSYWYEGPDFTEKYFIGNIPRNGEYYDDFSTIPMDVNGDGKTDFITGGWWSNNIHWRENPGNNGEWSEHVIGETGNVECTISCDVDNDGFFEIVPNTPGFPLKFYKLLRDKNNRPTAQFLTIQVLDKHDHGLGFGDINHDGRGDFIVSSGWAEAPVDPLHGKWVFHAEFDLGTASVPVIVADVNGDGKNDIIAGKAHDYGLDWYEQKTDNIGKRYWQKYAIDPFNSQFHALAWTDIDGDGKNELITGKRFRAHNSHDPGSFDDPGIYYYKWNGDSFTKQIVSGGANGKGTGIYFSLTDLRGTGRKDIIVAGKDGLFVFYNDGISPLRRK